MLPYPCNGWVESVQKPIGKRSGLLWRHASGELTLWDTVSGTRYWEHSLGFVDNSWQTVATGDFNGDGHGDILWRNTPYGLLSTWDLKDTTVVSYQPLTSNAPQGTPFSGDLDSDGVSDLVWTSSVYVSLPTPPWSLTIFIADTWMMNPDSTAPRSRSVTSAQGNRVVAVGNFDGDPAGGADVLRLATNGALTVSLSGGGGTKYTGTAPSTVPASSGWTIQGVADVDHDGVSARSATIVGARRATVHFATLAIPAAPSVHRGGRTNHKPQRADIDSAHCTTQFGRLYSIRWRDFVERPG